MNSRLSNYLESMKIAKMHLATAIEYDRKGQPDNVTHNLVRAMEYMITANNNMVSIAFNSKPKKRRTR